jgi:hypothetical protein
LQLPTHYDQLFQPLLQAPKLEVEAVNAVIVAHGRNIVPPDVERQSRRTVLAFVEKRSQREPSLL